MRLSSVCKFQKKKKKNIYNTTKYDAQIVTRDERADLCSRGYGIKTNLEKLTTKRVY